MVASDLHQWDLAFIPDHELRFAEPTAGRHYWLNLGRGFETADDLDGALQASLNALHNEPDNVEVAMNTADLFWRIAERHLQSRRLPDAMRALGSGTALLHRLFEHPLKPEQLNQIKSRLEESLHLLKEYEIDT